LHHQVPPILACGAELKNTVCLTKQDKAFVSQHIGDLENIATYDFLKLTVDHLKRILDIHPEIIACDLHPDYLSTRYAMEQEAGSKIQVQHHHAHTVSCMAEHNLDGPLIGLAFDGTGLGTDGAVWGGEILLAEKHDFRRAAHLAYVAMPGSAVAIKEPWRMAVSYLRDAYGPGIEALNLPAFADFERDKLAVVDQMIAKGLNSPPTSSLGRLFDGVAAICGIRSRVSFEGQAAMELEMQSAESAERGYEFEWEQGDVIRILTAPIIRGVVADILDKTPLAVIGARFHRTLISLFAALCEVLRKESGLNRVVLSGGCFQNATLLSGLIRDLTAHGFEVFSHEQVPANDGGISLGQAVVAAAVAKRQGL
jgi:hydrogenase maturation protein HypF